MMNKLIALAAALVLSGCGLPPVVTVASYALDGMSFLSTGKSVGDHAISAATKQDCSVWRVISDEQVCREFNLGQKSRLVLAAERWERGGEIVGVTNAEPFVAPATPPRAVMLAVVDPEVLPQAAEAGAGLGIRLPSGPIAASFTAIERAPPPDRLVRATSGAPWVLPVGAAPVPEVDRAHERLHRTIPDWPGTFQDAVVDRPILASATRRPKVLVLGSFAVLDNAKRAARQWSRFSPAIVKTRRGGSTFHRVIVGSLGGDLDRRRGRLASLGQRVWAANVCADSESDGRCVALPAILRR